MKIVSATGYYRTLSDRRICPTPIISRYTFSNGRRKTIRRKSEKRSNIYVDVYSTRLVIAVLSLLLLSCLDAFLTLTLIDKGLAYEANPFMAFFLDISVFHFSSVKFFITATALIALCLFKNVKITRIGLPVAIKIYIAVIIYEIYLYTN